MREIVFAGFSFLEGTTAGNRLVAHTLESCLGIPQKTLKARRRVTKRNFLGVTSRMVVADSYASTSAWFKYVLRQYRTMGYVVRTRLDLVCPDALIKYKVCRVSKLKGIMQNPNVPPSLTSLNAAHIIMH